MRSINLTTLLVVGTLSLPSAAHHSALYFDMESEITHENVTVVEWRVANPHGYLLYNVVDDEGNEVVWNSELPSANFTVRAGVGSDFLEPGDVVTVIGWPGTPGRTRENLTRLVRLELQNGDVAHFTGTSARLDRAAAE